MDSELGRKWKCSYGCRVTGFLRFVGMLNAAVWLGAAFFFTLGVSPALVSQSAQEVLTPKYFSYISGALWQIALAHYFWWHLVCTIIALLHLLAEWLYLGRAAHRAWLLLLGTLLFLSLLGSFWMAPKLAQLHRARHAVDPGGQVNVIARAEATKSYRTWHGMFQAANVLMIAGIAVYFWRATTPSDPLRFVGPVKFRS